MLRAIFVLCTRLLPRYGGYSNGAPGFSPEVTSCFPVMGVILSVLKNTFRTIELLPRYGGYSEEYFPKNVWIAVASPLWGLFSKHGRAKISDETSCFPVMGVIPPMRKRN